LHTIPLYRDTKISGNPHQAGGREEFTLRGFAVWTYSAIPKASSFNLMPPGIFKMEFLQLNLKFKFTEQH